jgi:hypothetical protein
MLELAYPSVRRLRTVDGELTSLALDREKALSPRHELLEDLHLTAIVVGSLFLHSRLLAQKQTACEGCCFIWRLPISEGDST